MGNGTVQRQKNGRRWILTGIKGMEGIRAGYGLWALGYGEGIRGEGIRAGVGRWALGYRKGMRGEMRNA